MWMELRSSHWDMNPGRLLACLLVFLFSKFLFSTFAHLLIVSFVPLEVNFCNYWNFVYTDSKELCVISLCGQKVGNCSLEGVKNW